MTPTPQAKAAVVRTSKTRASLTSARTRAHHRPQGLIGEKFVDCLPTQPRVEGTPLPPPLHKIPSGHEGEGEYLLPVQNTHSPVDVDLLGDINRLPERGRLTIIINEFGAGLAGRGSDLNTVIRRANPALQDFDKCSRSSRARTTCSAKLAVDSDQALQPLARVRKEFAEFFAQSATVAEASAAQRGALEENLAKFPEFLRQFGPSQERLQKFAKEAIPVFTDLGVAAPALNQAFEQNRLLHQLGEVLHQPRQDLEGVGPRDRRHPAAAEAPEEARRRRRTVRGEPLLAAHEPAQHRRPRAADGLHLPRRRRLQRLRPARAFPRTEGVASACLKYEITQSTTGCTYHLINTGSSGTATAASVSTGEGEKNAPIDPATTSVEMARTLAVVEGATPQEAIAKYPGKTEASASELLGVGSLGGSPSSAASSQPVGGSTAGTTYYSPSAEGSEAGGLLLNYLLGN